MGRRWPSAPLELTDPRAWYGCVYGWNLVVLYAVIESAIRSTYCRGRVTINFEVHANSAVVRLDAPLSRALSNTWLKILLVIHWQHARLPVPAHQF